jgi:site-specific DNA recombinase
MTEARCAAIYARISSDPARQALGVVRQLQDCRKIASDRDWTVTAGYVDNDVPACRSKMRTEYERMLSNIEAGRHDAVIAYRQDRLTRRPMEFEQIRSGLRQGRGVHPCHSHE